MALNTSRYCYMMKTILFICTGNICRSPMAAALMRERIAELGLADQVQVESAGVWAEEGFGASTHAVTVLAERGVDLRGHQSQAVTMRLLAQADIVLVMEEAHRRSIFYLAPQHLGKVFLLTEMSGQHDDIADPYGRSLDDYARTAQQLAALIEAGLPKILNRLGLRDSGLGTRD